MKKKTTIIVVVLVIITITFYQLYLKDYLAYREVRKERTEDVCQDYLYNFRNGYYVEDVRFIEVDVVRKIDKVKDFIDDYPSSEYSSRVTQIKDDLWNAEIVNYEQKVQQKKGKPKAVEFFRKLLNYMKNNNIYDINLKFQSNIELKDFEDYDEKAKLLLSMNASPPINGNMLPLKSNFSQGAISKLENIVEDGIENSLDSVFSAGFVNIDTENYRTDLLITINYTIKNQELQAEGVIFPNIWTYSVDNVFSSYLLGIAVEFNFDFALPGSELNYSFIEHSDPSGTISNIDNIQEGYSRMTQMTFALFANKISNNFGLDEGYN